MKSALIMMGRWLKKIYLKSPRKIQMIILIYLAMVLGYVVDIFFDYHHLGIVPRELSLSSFYGIFMNWTMHRDMVHLSQNMVALFPLLAIFMMNEARYQSALVGLVVLSGLLTWLLGFKGYHVGASGLIFALIGFVVVSIFIRKQLIYFLFVLFYFGSLWHLLKTGLIPQSHISWSAHFGGLVAGAGLAFAMAYYQRYMERKMAA